MNTEESSEMRTEHKSTRYGPDTGRSGGGDSWSCGSASDGGVDSGDSRDRARGLFSEQLNPQVERPLVDRGQREVAGGVSSIASAGGHSRGLTTRPGWRRLPALLVALVAFAGLGACGDDEPEPNDAPGWSSPDGDLGGPDYDADTATDSQSTEGPTTEIESPSLPAPRVLFLGDSLSAGLHLPADEAFPAVLEQRLAAAGQPFELLNAGVSGDTTAGGLARLDWLLRQDPDLVVVELGANDGLRGVSLKSVESNLRKIIARLQERDLPVLLLGMQLPPNYGATYAGGFKDLYQTVADDTGVHFVPFFLEGVAGDPKLNLPDGIHPTTEGHERIADNLEALMKDLVGDLRK